MVADITRAEPRVISGPAHASLPDFGLIFMEPQPELDYVDFVLGFDNIGKFTRYLVDNDKRVVCLKCLCPCPVPISCYITNATDIIYVFLLESVFAGILVCFGGTGGVS